MPSSPLPTGAGCAVGARAAEAAHARRTEPPSNAGDDSLTPGRLMKQRRDRPRQFVRCAADDSARSRLLQGRDMSPFTSRTALSLLVAVLALGTVRPASATPEGTMTWGVHITLAS